VIIKGRMGVASPVRRAGLSRCQFAAARRPIPNPRRDEKKEDNGPMPGAVGEFVAESGKSGAGRKVLSRPIPAFRPPSAWPAAPAAAPGPGMPIP
jgi:hypothetical protein